MKREIIQTKNFIKSKDDLLKKRQLLQEDYDQFQKEISQNPEKGDIIPGASGVRKIRLKSSSKGKRSGFRVCYYYYVIQEQIYLFFIYAKNEQENISAQEKKILKELVDFIKRGYKNE